MGSVGAEAPLVYQGRVYCYGYCYDNPKGPAYNWCCLDLKTGSNIWTKGVTWSQDADSAAVLADGKIIQTCGSAHYNGSGYDTVEMLKASGPEGYIQLALCKLSLKIVPLTSPAVADGRLFLRLQDGGVGCWDLRAK
jgi:hypothetical protein